MGAAGPDKDVFGAMGRSGSSCPRSSSLSEVAGACRVDATVGTGVTDSTGDDTTDGAMATNLTGAKSEAPVDTEDPGGLGG